MRGGEIPLDARSLIEFPRPLDVASPSSTSIELVASDDIVRITSSSSDDTIPVEVPILRRQVAFTSSEQGAKPHIGALCPGLDTPLELFQDEDGVYRPPRTSEKAGPILATVWEEQSRVPQARVSKTLDDVVSFPVRLESQDSSRLEGNQRHVRYRTHPIIPDPIHSDLEDESEDTFVDKEIVTCARALVGLMQSFRRVISSGRAMIDLVGIEPNPGPPKSAPAHKKKKSVKKEVTKVISVSSQKDPGTARMMKSIAGSPFNVRGDMSKYMATLMDAERYPPVRLGGETLVQTALTTLHGNFTYNVPANGTGSFVIHPRLWNPFCYTGDQGGANGYQYSTSPMFPTQNTAQLRALASGARVVSCKLKVFSLGAGTADNGLLIAGLCPRDDGFWNNTMVTNSFSSGWESFTNTVSSGGFPIGSTISAANSPVPNANAGFNSATQGATSFQNYDFTDEMPLKQGCSVFWLPEDPQTFEFMRDRIIAQAGVVPGSLASTTTSVSITPVCDPFFVIGILGASPNTQVQFELFLNLEYTTTSGASQVINTDVGAMSTTDAFHVVKRVGGGAINMVEPDPEASFGSRLGGFAKTLGRAGLSSISKFLFSSSDVGVSLSNALGL